MDFLIEGACFISWLSMKSALFRSFCGWWMQAIYCKDIQINLWCRGHHHCK